MTSWNSENLLDMFPKFGQGIGLHRMLWLVEELFPHREIPTIKVTGSNGKGSVCAMLDAVLGALGFKRGLYTSPHLKRLHERIRWNGKPIGNAAFHREITWLEERVSGFSEAFPGDRIGGFEALTAMAYHFFLGKNPEALVLEVGIGGRFDAIRALPGSWVVLASLDLEHTERLGTDLESICFQKIDLCPEGGNLVLGSMEDPTLLQRIRYYCRLKNIRLLAVDDRCRLLDCRSDRQGMVLRLGIEDLVFEGLALGLRGVHQARNAMAALLCLFHFLKQFKPDLNTTGFSEAVRGCFPNIQVSGRLERIQKHPEVWIDLAHTPAAVEALVQAVRPLFGQREVLLVTGASENKNVEALCGRLSVLASEIVCTRAYHLGAPVARVLAAVQKARPDLNLHSTETIEEAVKKVNEIARGRDMTVLVAGGLFLAVEAGEAFAGRDPRRLRFF